MASIQEYLDLIKSAIYGKDVRQAIHDGIQQCYYDGKAGSTDLEARQRLDTAEGSISSLGSRMSTAETDIDVLDARVDQIVAPSGEAPSAAEVSDARVGTNGATYPAVGDAIRNQVKSVKNSMDSVLLKEFGVESFASFDAYSANSASVTATGVYPCVMYNKIVTGIVSAIKLKVHTAGKLSVGYYNGTSGSGGILYDPSKVVITNELTIASTGEMVVQLPNPFIVPDGASLLFGLSTDTLKWLYGGDGNDKGFAYVVYGEGYQYPTFEVSSAKIGITAYSYSDSQKINAIDESLDSIETYLKGENTVVLDGYDTNNTEHGTYNTSPYILLKDLTRKYYITDFLVNVRFAGSITIGTIKKSDAVQGASYDINKLKIHETIPVSSVGVQTIKLKAPMELPTDEYAFIGIPSDTAGHYYGSQGADHGFLFVANGNVYAFSIGSVNVALYGTEYNLDEMQKPSIYEGKKISILGDSISTFLGYIPEGNATYYPSGTVQSVADTWWYKLYTALGMTLEVNNSWSGSRVTTTAGDTSAGCMTRCQGLGTNPDVIIVWMGINDFNNEVALGSYDGTTSLPSVTTTFREAYAIMLNKILTTYQSSEVWVCTLPQCERNAESGFPEINGNGVALAEFNKAILELANAFGVKVLDHNKCGLTYQNMPTYNPDNLHPNNLGHSLVANNDIRQMDNVVRTRY